MVGGQTKTNDGDRWQETKVKTVLMSEDRWNLISAYVEGELKDKKR